MLKKRAHKTLRATDNMRGRIMSKKQIGILLAINIISLLWMLNVCNPHFRDSIYELVGILVSQAYTYGGLNSIDATFALFSTTYDIQGVVYTLYNNSALYSITFSVLNIILIAGFLLWNKRKKAK